MTEKREITSAELAEREGYPVPAPQKMIEQALDRKISALLQGDIEPPNEMVAYLVEKAKGAHAQATQARNNVNVAKQLIQKNEQEMLEAKGRIDGYVADIKHWLQKEEASDDRESKGNGRDHEAPDVEVDRQSVHGAEDGSGS